MHITSTITSHPGAPPTDDVPVSALLFGERGVLVARPETYEDIEAVVRATFGLAATQAVMLETDTLNICRGRRFEIDRSAWPALRALLDVVLVTAGEARRADADAGQLEAREIAPGAPLTPASSSGTLGPRRYSAPKPERSQGAAGREADAEARSPPESPRAGKRPRQDTSDDDLYIRDSPAPASALAPDSEHEFVPGSRQSGESEEEEEDDPPEPEFIMKVSESESESEPDDPPVARDAPKPKVAGSGGGGADARKAKAPVTQEAQSRPFQWKTKDKPVVVKKEKQPAASSPPDADQALGDDPRFLVDVKHAASDRQAMFKTRAGHKVEKVLAGVCKSFGLDYERATLVLLVEIEGDKAHRFPCEKAETMGRCGIEAGARLVVETDDT